MSIFDLWLWNLLSSIETILLLEDLKDFQWNIMDQSIRSYYNFISVSYLKMNVINYWKDIRMLKKFISVYTHILSI